MTMYRYTPRINFDFSVELKMLGVSVLYGLINLFLFRYVKKDRGVIMMISLIFQIGTLCLIYDDIWKLVVCIVAFLFILVAVVPK
ncbi:hypothetical protein [Carnobacterium maltaromaticum]|uniref:hypothetical protein n=1 Tax=Carnobacterium maltaromaticum TaxID=2751 RepID=UPI0039BDD9B0